MKITSAKFVLSATAPNHYPAPDRPEIAFLGRSNVGKSSLINSLLQVKGLARTSSTPGRTQLINFFLIEEAFYFVDLPGYGFAKVPQAVREQWGPMIEQYLNQRESLTLCILIVDARHEPQRLDRQMHDWLVAKHREYCVIATKADKLSKNQLFSQIAKLKAVYGPAVIPYSAVTRQGDNEVWKTIRAGVDSFVKPTAAR